MKLFSIKRLKNLMIAGTALLSLTATTSCESIYDEQGDCDPHYYLKFVFDRNLLYNDNHTVGADAFAAQVGSVDVYLFDAETGDFVTHLSEKGSPLREAGYRMPLDIPPGNYHIIAWCGLQDNDGHFTVADETKAITHHSQLSCFMHREYDENGLAYNAANLNPLFHGTVTYEFPDEQGEHWTTVYLTKDTNNIQLALQHMSGALDPDRFNITFCDTNGHLNSDNSLKEDEVVEFRPWVKTGGVVDMFPTKADGVEDAGTGFLVAELSTSRLMANHNPNLDIVDKETGNTVFSIPFMKWALMFKSAKYSYMDDQEYLDRQDEYEVMVILDNDNENNDGWIAYQIVINGWHIVDNGMIELN